MENLPKNCLAILVFKKSKKNEQFLEQIYLHHLKLYKELLKRYNETEPKKDKKANTII